MGELRPFRTEFLVIDYFELSAEVADTEFNVVCSYSACKWKVSGDFAKEIFPNGIRTFAAKDRPKNWFFPLFHNASGKYVCALVVTVECADKKKYVQKVVGVVLHHPFFAFAQTLLETVVAEKRFFNASGEKSVPEELKTILDVRNPTGGKMFPEMHYGEKLLPRIILPSKLGFPHIDSNLHDVFFGMGTDFIASVFLAFFSGSTVFIVSSSENYLTRFSTGIIHLCFPFFPQCRRVFLNNETITAVESKETAFYLIPRPFFEEMSLDVIPEEASVYDIDIGEIIIEGTKHGSVNGVPFPAIYRENLENDLTRVITTFTDDVVTVTLKNKQLSTWWFRTAFIRFIAVLLKDHRQFIYHSSLTSSNAQVNKPGFLESFEPDIRDWMEQMLECPSIMNGLCNGRPFPLGDVLDHVITRQIWKYPLEEAVQQVMLVDGYLSSPMGDFNHFKTFERNIIKLSDLYETDQTTIDVSFMKPHTVNVIVVDINTTLFDFEEATRIFSSYNFHIKYPVREPDDFFIEKVDVTKQVRIDLLVRILVRNIFVFENIDVDPLFHLIKSSRYFRKAFLRETLIALREIPKHFLLDCNPFLLLKQLVTLAMHECAVHCEIGSLLRIFEIMDRTHYMTGGSVIYMHNETNKCNAIPFTHPWDAFFSGEKLNQFCNKTSSNLKLTTYTVLDLMEIKSRAAAERTAVHSTFRNFMRYVSNFDLDTDEFVDRFKPKFKSQFLSDSDRKTLAAIIDKKKEYVEYDHRLVPVTKFSLIVIDEHCHTRDFIQKAMDRVELAKREISNDISVLFMSCCEELDHWFKLHAPRIGRTRIVRFAMHYNNPLDGETEAPARTIQLIRKNKGFDKASLMVYAPEDCASECRERLKGLSNRLFVASDFRLLGKFVKDGLI